MKSLLRTCGQEFSVSSSHIQWGFVFKIILQDTFQDTGCYILICLILENGNFYEFICKTEPDCVCVCLQQHIYA